MDHAGAGPVDEEPANIGVSTLADPEQGRFASGGVLSTLTITEAVAKFPARSVALPETT